MTGSGGTPAGGHGGGPTPSPQPEVPFPHESESPGHGTPKTTTTNSAPGQWIRGAGASINPAIKMNDMTFMPGTVNNLLTVNWRDVRLHFAAALLAYC